MEKNIQIISSLMDISTVNTVEEQMGITTELFYKKYPGVQYPLSEAAKDLGLNKQLLVAVTGTAYSTFKVAREGKPEIKFSSVSYLGLGKDLLKEKCRDLFIQKEFPVEKQREYLDLFSKITDELEVSIIKKLLMCLVMLIKQNEIEAIAAIAYYIYVNVEVDV